MAYERPGGKTSCVSCFRHIVTCGVLVALAIGLRSAGIHRPLVGNFATKNIVYAMIARNWAEGRAGLLYPTLDCLRGGCRSLHLLELPVSAYLTGLAWRTCGGSLDVWGRATSIAWSAGSVALIFLLVRRRHGPAAALGAAAALALSPVSVIYGQCFMLEASLVFFTLAVFDSLDRWLRGRHSGWLALAACWLALVLLTKIYMLVILLPFGFDMLVRKRSAQDDHAAFDSRSKAAALLALALAVLPAALWCWHAVQTAAPSSPWADRIFYSVRDSVSIHFPPHPILTSADFYRQILDDMATVVLTPVGLVFALAGLCHPAWRRYIPWLAASAVLVALLPLKFYELNYYWMAVLPPLAILVGLGWEIVWTRIQPGRCAVCGLVAVALAFSLRHAVRPAFVTPEEDRSVVAAGRAIQQIARPAEPVATMHGTTIDLLYYCNRPGWAVAPRQRGLERALDECRQQGARYLVVCGPTGNQNALSLEQIKNVCVEGFGFRVYRLGPCPGQSHTIP